MAPPPGGAGPPGLVPGMLRARSVHLEPLVYTSLMVDAKAGQASYGVARGQLLQADHALAFRIAEYVLVI